MIDFLSNFGIQDKTIAVLNNKYHGNILYSLSCNQYEIEKIIPYLDSIGIKNIDEFLINNIDLFLNTLDHVKKTFAKYDIETLVEIINNNPNDIKIV